MLRRAKRSTSVRALFIGTGLWGLTALSYGAWGAVALAWGPCVVLAWVALKLWRAQRSIESGLSRNQALLVLAETNSKRILAEMESLQESGDRLVHRSFMQSAQLAALESQRSETAQRQAAVEATESPAS
jgi:hypothetical protein